MSFPSLLTRIGVDTDNEWIVLEIRSVVWLPRTATSPINAAPRTKSFRPSVGISYRQSRFPDAELDARNRAAASVSSLSPSSGEMPNRTRLLFWAHAPPPVLPLSPGISRVQSSPGPTTLETASYPNMKNWLFTDQTLLRWKSVVHCSSSVSSFSVSTASVVRSPSPVSVPAAVDLSVTVVSRSSHCCNRRQPPVPARHRNESTFRRSSRRDFTVTHVWATGYQQL